MARAARGMSKTPVLSLIDNRLGSEKMFKDSTMARAVANLDGVEAANTESVDLRKMVMKRPSSPAVLRISPQVANEKEVDWGTSTEGSDGEEEEESRNKKGANESKSPSSRPGSALDSPTNAALTKLEKPQSLNSPRPPSPQLATVATRDGEHPSSSTGYVASRIFRELKCSIDHIGGGSNNSASSSPKILSSSSSPRTPLTATASAAIANHLSMTLAPHAANTNTTIAFANSMKRPEDLLVMDGGDTNSVRSSSPWRSPEDVPSPRPLHFINSPGSTARILSQFPNVPSPPTVPSARFQRPKVIITSKKFEESPKDDGVSVPFSEEKLTMSNIDYVAGPTSPVPPKSILPSIAVAATSSPRSRFITQKSNPEFVV